MYLLWRIVALSAAMYLIKFYFDYYSFTIENLWSVSEGRRIWRYQRGNQNPYIEKHQTTQWLKEKVQTDKCHQWDPFISYLPLQRSQQKYKKILLRGNIYYLNVKCASIVRTGRQITKFNPASFWWLLYVGFPTLYVMVFFI